MTVDLTSAEFRQLLDMVYIGNWVLNSARGDDRITEYDRIESKIFGRIRCQRRGKRHGRRDRLSEAQRGRPGAVPFCIAWNAFPHRTPRPHRSPDLSLRGGAADVAISQNMVR